MDEGGFVIDYLTPPGTALEETDRQVRKVEEVLADTPGGGGLLAPHRGGAGPVRHPAQQRATSWCG